MKHLALLILLLLCTNAFAGEFTSWTWSIPSGSSGTFTASESTQGVNLSGDFQRIAGTSLIKLTVTASSGPNAPAVGTIRYALEAPGFSLFIDPTLNTEQRVIQTTIGGICPNTVWTGNFIFKQWPSVGFNMAAATPVFGVFTWNPSLNQIMLNTIYQLGNYTLMASNVPLPGTCANGVITLSGIGDRGGKMYISSYGGAVYNVNTGANSKSVYAMPNNNIPSLATLNGSYVAYSYNNQGPSTIKFHRVVIDSTQVGSEVWFKEFTNIDTMTDDALNGFKLADIQLNSPSPGFFKANLKKRIAGVDTTFVSNTEMICSVHIAPKSVISCLGHDNGLDERNPRSFTIVSDTQAIPAGSSDTYAFNGTGITEAAFNASNVGKAVALQSNRRIIVVGTTFNGTDNDMAIARFLPDGSLDTTFSTDGKITQAFAANQDYGRGVAVQSDGKIVVAGYHHNGTNEDIAVARYLTDGQLDVSFSGDGLMTTPIGTSDDEAYRVAIDSAGRILVTGWSYYGSISDFIMLRLLSNGTLDTSFNAVGHNHLRVGSFNNSGNGILIRNNGSIMSYGHRWGFLEADFAAVQFTSTGAVDTTWDTDGKYNVAFNSSRHEQAWAGAIWNFLSGEKIVLAGFAANGSNDDFGIMRWNSNGGLDTSFDGDGKVTTSFGSGLDQAYGAAITSDNKLVVSGITHNGVDTDFAVARYLTNGALDTTFHGDGKFTAPVGTGNDVLADMAIQSDGKILLAGEKAVLGGTNFAVMRIWGN